MMNGHVAARAAIALACAGMFFSGAARAATAPVWSIPSSDSIRQLLAERMEHNGVGVVVGIIEPQGRRIVVYGKSDAANGRPLDGDTIFQIGSVSKTFVGLLLADMVLRGEVGLDDPASKFLPRGVKLAERDRPITLADLSTHMSGLPPMPTNFDLKGMPDPIEAYRLQDLYQFLSTYQLPRAPGAKPEYSNLGVSLLGRLLALRAGTDYESLLRNRVLSPLGMSSTAIVLSAEQTSRLTPGHDRDLKPVHSPEMRTLAPSGSLRSSANDLLNYLAANLGYLDSALRQAMLYQRSAVRAPLSAAPLRRGWAQQTLGWRVRIARDHEVFGHEGGKQGYRCSVVFDPTLRIGVVVLANARTDDEPGALAIHLLTGTPLQPAPPAIAERAFAKIDPAILDSYGGSYRVGNEATIRVARRGKKLLVDFLGEGPTEFFPEDALRFGTRADDVQITFDVDRNGSVLGLKWYPDGRDAGKHRDAVRIP